MISIIGGGPAGCHAAKLLAEAGKEVRLIEEHPSIGRPVQCTGIVTQSMNRIIRLRKDLIVNRPRKAILHSPDGSTAEIKTTDIVIDRKRFDAHLAEKAEKKGVRILLNTKLTGIRRRDDSRIKIRLKDNKKKKSRIEETKTLIGADGPKSLVSRSMGNNMTRYWVGVQALVKMPVDARTYSVYFGDELPGFFGWSVPEDENMARVGIATTRNPNAVFKKFIRRFEKCKVLEMQGGLIPRHDPGATLQDGNIFIVGDAAAQVKATTGGGLVPGMKAAECLAKAIIEKRSYPRELKGVRRELLTSLLLRNMMDRFKEEDYNRLIRICSERKIKQTLNKEDRDSPTRLVFKSLIRKPELLLFMKTLLRAKRVENA